MKRLCVVSLVVLASLLCCTVAKADTPSAPAWTAGGEAPLLCQVSTVPNDDADPQNPFPITVYCQGNCGTTSASWACLNRNCCQDCSNPMQPIFGCQGPNGCR